MGYLDQFTGYLMSQDTELAIIEQGQLVRVLDTTRLPFHFIYASDPSLRSWVEQRALDISRTNSRFLLREIDFEQQDIEEMVLSINAAAITDTYWLKEQGSDLTYEQIRFKENDLARVALLGSSAGIKNPSPRTPEISNTGSFEKCWRIEDGHWWLYKKGEIEHTFSELACQELGRYLGMKMAHYEFVPREQINQIFQCRVSLAFSAVKSLDFSVGATYNFETAIGLGCKKEDTAGSYKVLEALSPVAAEQYKQMVLLDALTYNIDRHLNNFGVLRDVMTGEVISLAPVYDQNLALSTALMDYDHIIAGERDAVYQGWARLVDELGEKVYLPSLRREQLTKVVGHVDLSGFPAELREQVVDILEIRGRWIEEKVEQINKVYAEPSARLENLHRSL